MSRDWLLVASARWFRLLLWLYPADFRDEMGDAVVEGYRERSREAIRDGGALRLAGIWWTALGDFTRNGLGERFRPAADWRRPGDWGRDIELVGRRLLHKPMFLAAVLGTLTIGLAIFAVVFTAVDKILIEDLPYRDPQNLYWVSADIPRMNIKGGHLFQLGQHGFRDVLIHRWPLPRNAAAPTVGLAQAGVVVPLHLRDSCHPNP